MKIIIIAIRLNSFHLKRYRFATQKTTTCNFEQNLRTFIFESHIMWPF